MLQYYSELAESIKKQFNSINTWPEIEFNFEDKKKIMQLQDVTNVGNNSIQIKIDNNHCVIPGQYVLYAVCIKELALAINGYIDIFEKIKKGKSANETASIINSQQFNFNTISVDEYSKGLALKIFSDPNLNLGAKTIVNGSDPKYNIRSVADYYTSIVLKPINVPAASSDILGKFIFHLSQNIDLYNYLEKRFINKISYIRKEDTINAFVKKVLTFLYQYDKLAVIKDFFTEKTSLGLISIQQEGSAKLTSIFKASNTLLKDDDLKQGEKFRFFKDPLFIIDNEFMYLSTEWTNEKESRLDLQSFKLLIDKCYPEFIVNTVDDIHYFKSRYSLVNKSDNQSSMDINKLKEDFSHSGLKISDGIITRFVSSLLAKPFVILTGLSGSGKTKLAQAFAKWICENENEYCIIPVGSDWTNREPLLGFPNALKNGEYIKPENNALDLIIKSELNPSKPYFLILDEMNLSHVERYFADFLSVMESNQKISLHSGSQNWNGVPSEISLPKNLFIIGTVNIDETTYMFSPKVLDRANVIEFRVTDSEMKSYLSLNQKLDLKQLTSRGASFAEDFVDISNDDSIKVLDTNELESALIIFFKALKDLGAEFGYRSAAEILRFAGVVNKIEPTWSMNHIIDAAILQKLLPKVHGSRRKLEGILISLSGLCLHNNNDITAFLSVKPSEINFNDTAKIKYPLSLEKILRMHHNMLTNGFTSYAEA